METLLLSCVQHSARQRIRFRPSKDLEVMPVVDKKKKKKLKPRGLNSPDQSHKTALEEFKQIQICPVSCTEY